MWLVAPWGRGWKIFLTVLPLIAFILLLPSLLLGRYQSEKRINQPSHGYRIYKDENYGFSFHYPENWSVTSQDTPASVINASKDKALATPLRSVYISDIPHPSNISARYPACEITIGTHANREQLPLETWYGRELDEVVLAPKDEAKRKAMEVLKQTTYLTLNGIRFLQASSQGPYLWSQAQTVYMISMKKNEVCSSGYDLVFNSIHFD